MYHKVFQTSFFLYELRWLDKGYIIFKLLIESSILKCL